MTSCLPSWTRQPFRNGVIPLPPLFGLESSSLCSGKKKSFSKCKYCFSVYFYYGLITFYETVRRKRSGKKALSMIISTPRPRHSARWPAVREWCGEGGVRAVGSSDGARQLLVPERPRAPFWIIPRAYVCWFFLSHMFLFTSLMLGDGSI